MAVTVSATPLPSATPQPYTEVNVYGLTVAANETVTVYRSWAGQQAPIRAAMGVPVTGAAMSFNDTECPFGIPVSYTAQDYSGLGVLVGTGSSSSISLAVSVVWISDPLDPRTAQAVEFAAGALSNANHDRDGVVMPISGSDLPAAIVGTRRQGSALALDLMTYTVADRQSAIALLSQADPVLVRVPSDDAYAMLPPLAYVTAPTVAEQPYEGLAYQYARIIWTGVLVRPPTAGIVIPLRTYADGLNDAPTYANSTSLYATYLIRLRGH